MPNRSLAPSPPCVTAAMALVCRLPCVTTPVTRRLSDWLGTDVDENLYDAILLNASRIGHGYGIVKHPLLMQEAARRGIAMEVCPISNQVRCGAVRLWGLGVAFGVGNGVISGTVLLK